MKTILLAVLLAAAPVLAHDYPGDDGYDDDDDSGYSDSDYAPPDQGPTYDDFRNDSELSWNGEWIDTPEYGVVWRPTRVGSEWQPYFYGRWAWTEAGWAWISDEPFGWAVYHYGRWAFSPVTGWFWIPGRIWAPAWVSWRWGEGYAGWCALGPRHHRMHDEPVRWVYVPTRHFLEPVRHHVIPKPRRPGLPAPIAYGVRAAPPVRAVEQATGRAVRPLAVTDAPAPHAAQATSGSVGFYRPRTAPVAVPAPRPRPQQEQGAARPHAVTPRPQALPPRPDAERSHGAGAPPAPRQGAQPRAQPAPRATPAPTPAQPAKQKEESKSRQIVPHARER